MNDSKKITDQQAIINELETRLYKIHAMAHCMFNYTVNGNELKNSHSCINESLSELIITEAEQAINAIPEK